MYDNYMAQAFGSLEKERGLPQGFLTAMAGIESRWGGVNDRPGSQYRGMFQLGDAVRKQYGVADPSDWRASARAAADYANANRDYLRKVLGREPTGPELYLAHQQGAGGASKLLGHPDAPAGTLTKPQFIASNNGDPNAPASSFIKQFEDKYNSRLGGPSAEGPRMPEPAGPPMAFAAKEDPNAENPINQQFGKPAAWGDTTIDTGGPQQESGWETAGNVGNGMIGLGAALMSINNPDGARVLMGLQKQNKPKQTEFLGFTPNKQGMLYQKADGTFGVAPLPAGAQGDNTSELPAEVRAAQWFKTHPDDQAAYDKMHGREPLPEQDSKMWADYVISDPNALRQVPAKYRPQVMGDLRKLAEDAGFSGKDLLQTVQNNAGNLADEKRRSQIIAQLDTFKSEFFAGAKLVNEYSKDLERTFGAKPLEELYQWAQKNTGDPNADKIVKLQTALEGLARGYNRAMSTGSGGNVTGEDRMTKLLSSAMPASQITAGLQSLTSDVVNVNKFAKEARDNQRARNAGKPLPHPELENEDMALKNILGIGQPQPQTPAATTTTEDPNKPKKRFKWNRDKGDFE